MGAAVLVGTRKGLFVLTSGETRREWSVEGPHLTGWEVFHAMRDSRAGTLHAAKKKGARGVTLVSPAWSPRPRAGSILSAGP